MPGYRAQEWILGFSTMQNEVAEGQLLAGQVPDVVERVLGQGGMGVVVAAHHVVLDQKVAIKFLLPEALAER